MRALVCLKKLLSQKYPVTPCFSLLLVPWHWSFLRRSSANRDLRVLQLAPQDIVFGQEQQIVFQTIDLEYIQVLSHPDAWLSLLDFVQGGTPHPRSLCHLRTAQPPAQPCQTQILAQLLEQSHHTRQENGTTFGHNAPLMIQIYRIWSHFRLIKGLHNLLTPAPLPTPSAGAQYAFSTDTTLSDKFLTQDLRLSLYPLGRIRGEVTSEDLLGSIFSGFCIGK